ncbi:MAG: hypothetical protein JWM32_197 [Verrucomicrobia bacterium]|nr:hypothetical protein [Verrucomicrobiota bacterium]
MDPLPLSSWQRVLVLAVHPDDESLGAGGLIQQAVARGATVQVIVVTDGDNNPWPQRFIERHWHLDSGARARWGARRRAEATAALACLGVASENVSFWHFPDQGLTPLLVGGGESVIARLCTVIDAWKPTLLVAPSIHDLHPDHSALAVLLELALARQVTAKIRPFAILQYVVHSRGGDAPGEHLQIALSPEQVERKRQAILCHATQMALSRRRFLAFAQPSEVFLTGPTSVPGDSSHPILAADFSDGFLCLQAKDLPSRGTLYLAAETPAGSVRHSLSLEGVPERFARGDEAQAHRVLRRGHDELLLPTPLFAPAKSLFAKIVSRPPRFGLYDRTSWCEIPLARPSVPSEIESYQSGAGPRVCCVIPCYNLAGICGPIVRAAANFADHVIAVDDGSTDATERVLAAVAEESGGRVQVLTFPSNRGKGIALLEAFRVAARSGPFDVVVTLDGDGQHRPEDIPRLAQALVAGRCTLVIGERLARVKMPFRSRLGNTLTAAVMKFLHPAAPTDTQSGLRAFAPEFIREIVATIEGGRYETELEILLLALNRRRRIGSVPIPTVYLDGNRLSHFRPLIDSWRIYRTLLRRQFNPLFRPPAKAIHVGNGKLDLQGLDSGRL